MKISIETIRKEIQDVLLKPKQFWVEQKDQQKSNTDLLLGYYFPILLLVAVAVFLGEFLSSSHFYMGVALLKALREILLFTFQYFLSVFFTTELMKTFGAEKNSNIAQKLVAYSITPLLLVSLLTGLIPFLYVVDILGMYSFYIFWVGASELLTFPENKKNSYILITVVLNFFVFSFLSIFLSKLLSAYF